MYTECEQVLLKGATILDKIRSYQSCDEAIRKAISAPGTDAEKKAMQALLPAVLQLKDMFDYSQDLEQIFPRLLTVLMKDPAVSSSGASSSNQTTSALATQQALAKQLADVLDFVLQFDDAKMVNPGIQNDFSYYRRSLARLLLNKETADEIVVKDDLGNRMSLFFASPTPMMTVLTRCTTQFVEESGASVNVTRDSVTIGMSLMANVCYEMVAKRRFTSVKTNMFCLRCMTCSIILVDHISRLGAFHKKSLINVKGCVTALKAFSSEQDTSGLVNALRFTTIHLNDPDTPSSIKSLLS